MNDSFTAFHVHGSDVAERIAGRPFYYAQVRVDPTNEDRVYNLHGTIDRSEDGGKLFRPLLRLGRVHGDHHAFWVSPDGKFLIDGNDGGVYLSRETINQQLRVCVCDRAKGRRLYNRVVSENTNRARQPESSRRSRNSRRPADGALTL